MERFETEPARQGQHDWSEYTVLLGSAVAKVCIHSLILGCSRYQHLSAQECFRKASMDCLASYDGSRYAVPWQYAGKHVWLRLTRNLGLETMATTGEVLTRHRLNPKSGSTNNDPKHYQGLQERPDEERALPVLEDD